MANYYTLFSGLIENLTDDEVAWLRRQLQYLYVLDGKPYTKAEVPNGQDIDSASWEGYRVYLDEDSIASENCDDCDLCECPQLLGFEYDLSDSDRRLWIYSEDDGGDIDKVGMLVASFLQEFRPNDLWTLTWASTCSRPRVDEFGGGCLFAVAGEYDPISTWYPHRPRKKVWNAIVRAHLWVEKEWGGGGQ